MSYPRRRVRFSDDPQHQTDTGPPPLAETPSAPSTTPGDVATGFDDIYNALTPRQFAVITVGSAIGTGLMIGTGRALSISGPAAITISYTVVGFSVYLVLSALGEVAAWLPRPYTVADQAVRFCDPALGFSLGWIYWLKYAIVTPNQLTAAALLISYWLDPERVNPGVWITVFLLTITALNYLHHGLASQVEFYVSSFKLLVMFALMILSLVIALGGGPDRDMRGFRYWKGSGSFGSRYDHSLVENLVLTCGTMSSAAFVYIGSERAGIMVQSPNVRKAISRSIKHTFYRSLVFHLLAIILLGMLVPHDSIALAFYRKAQKGAAASPFVAALYLAGIPVVPDILNAFILLFVLSIANYDLWLATKAMCDLAIKHRAPAFLSRVNRRGVPVYALAVCASVATLAYLNVPQDTALMFGYFMDTVTMLGLLTWISILLTHLSFVRARRAQGIDDKDLSFKAQFGPAGTWLALALCLFISTTMIFGAFSFESGEIKFDYRSFVASYIGIPIYLSLYIGHKVARKSKHVIPSEVDLWTDKQEPPNELEEIRPE
ncbi:uncharacterized protein N7498_010925 [Penicillium cinerascens]|uniref:Amino acid permease/ SLC12A domain-containing protein n=1 Tax=Penicillium cinerascens TaxID=70096 RepID=A0A9W9JBM1_9EURO|nr:uncharacterized protein N7498_010925 [Penicillium cinerascens]KAJ5191940.1 hypothetical protein N7498_010925 [Penicillium cinerascens]